MTIATDAGFIVDGIYIATGKSKWFTEGSIVTLEHDDGTGQPLFKLLEGDCCVNNAKGREPGAYEFLDNLRLPSFIEFLHGKALQEANEYATMSSHSQEGEGNIMTPSQEAGFSQGDTLQLAENNYIETGALVELERDDGSVMPFVRVLTGEHVGLGLWMPVEVMRKRTPAQAAGIEVGDKVEVVTKSSGGTIRFDLEVNVGDILTLSEDDGTDMPIFTMENGRIVCPKIGNVSKVEDEHMTPAEAAGIEIGEKVVVNYDGHHAWDKGDIIEFIFDDGSSCPEFRGPCGTVHYIFVKDVRKQTAAEKGESGELIEVGEHVEEGDILILKNGQTAVVDSSGYPDSDGDYDTVERFVNKSAVEAIYRKAKPQPEPEEEKAEVTIKLSQGTLRKLAITGSLLEEHEVSGDYSDEFKKAVVETIHAVKHSTH